MSGRRGAGEGSIFYESTKGLYCAQVYVVTSSGRRKAVRRRAKTKKEANNLLIEMQIQHRSGCLIPNSDTRLTVAEHIDYWVDHVLPGRGSVRPSTQDQYRWALNRYVIPKIGNVQLGQLSVRHVEDVFRAMHSRGLSSSTIAKARIPLKLAMDEAVKQRLLRDNPVKAAQVPKNTSRPKRDALSRSELVRMLAAAKGHRIEPLVRLAFMTGLRRGELLALRWGDVDFESNILHVSGTLKSQPGGGWYFDLPKTEQGNRSIPLTSLATETLETWRTVQETDRKVAGAQWQDYGFIFTTPMGTPLDGRNVLRQWQGCSEAAGLGKVRFHAARHTFATLALESGRMELHALSRVLGHGSIAVTADIYSNVAPVTMRKDIAQALTYMGLEGLESDDEPDGGESVTD